MPTSREDMIRVAAGTAFPVAFPGVADPVPVEGVHGYATPSAHPIANAVVADGLDERDLDAAIAAVIAFFAERGNAFLWLALEDEPPRGLAEQLEHHGLAPTVDLAGMVLRDATIPIPTPPEITVRTADFDDERVADMMRRVFGLPDSATEALANLRARRVAGTHSATYVAHAPESDAPIGIADFVQAPGTSAVMLSGAATEEAFRGRGVYRALLKRRLDDARAVGADTAVIRAARDTSAPICARLGFEEFVAIRGWCWRPSDRNPRR